MSAIALVHYQEELCIVSAELDLVQANLKRIQRSLILSFIYHTIKIRKYRSLLSEQQQLAEFIATIQTWIEKNK